MVKEIMSLTLKRTRKNIETVEMPDGGTGMCCYKFRGKLRGGVELGPQNE